MKGKKQTGLPNASKAEINRHFENLLGGTSEEVDIHSFNNSGSIAQFTETEVMSDISESAKRKAARVDNILNEHLKIARKSLIKPWTSIYNYCTENYEVSSDWKQGLLYKGKGDRNAPGNYRGISLLCNQFKILTKLVKQRLETLTEHRLNDNQNGFRKNPYSEAFSHMK